MPQGGRHHFRDGRWGRYRLEVSSADQDGPESSVEFNAGWYVTAKSTETPDALDIALDKPSYKVGETAKLKLTSRYGGHVMVMAGSETLLPSMRPILRQAAARLPFLSPLTGVPAPI